MKTQHTPGPWHIEIEHPNSAFNVATDQQLIAEDIEDETNARLIAKAYLIPEIRDVLRAVHAVYEPVTQIRHDGDALSRVEALLAKLED